MIKGNIIKIRVQTHNILCNSFKNFNDLVTVMLREIHNTEERKTVYIPAGTWTSLKKEFDLSEGDMEAFIVTTLEKIAAERSQEINSAGVTEDEANEIEDNLKGLGYL
jgi:hypothetical protein